MPTRALPCLDGTNELMHVWVGLALSSENAKE